MQLRTLASIAVAVMLGIIAVLLVRGAMMSQDPRDTRGQIVPVVVAAKSVERGAALKAPLLKVVSYPKDSVPAGAFQSIDQVIGEGPERTVIRPLAANEPVLPAKLSGGAQANLSGALTPGMRAVSVPSGEVPGVGGFVLPGDRVDILVTRNLGEGEGETTITQVLAENALVLGVNQTSDLDADKPMVAKAVTVEVTPDQAQNITLAQSLGTVSLALRQIADNGALSRRVTTIADLGGLGFRKAVGRTFVAAKPKVVAALEPKPIEVRVTRGTETSGYSLGTE